MSGSGMVTRTAGRSRREHLILLLVVSMLLASACSSGDDGSDDDGSTDATAAATEDGEDGDATPKATEETAEADGGDEGEEENGDAGTDAAGEASGEPIRVGALLSTAGSLEVYAAAYQQGFDYFIENIGTIGGRPVEVVVVDDGGAPAEAATAVQRLIDEEVDFAVGPFLSGPSSAVLGPLNEAGIVNINLSTFTDAGDYETYPLTFHLEWDAGTLTEAMLEWTCDQGLSTIGLIAINNPQGTDTDNQIQDLLPNASCELEYLGAQQFATGATDALAQASALRDADVVYEAASSPPDIATIVNSLNEVGFEGYIVGNQGLGFDFAVDLFDEGIIDQVVPFGVTERLLTPLDDDVQEWLDGISEFLGEPPGTNALKGYDALWVLHQAAEGAGSTEADAVVQWLEGDDELCGIFGCYEWAPDYHHPFHADQNVPWEPGTEFSGFADPLEL